MFKYTVILVVICKPCYSANTKLAQIQSLLSRSSLRNMVHLKDTIFRLTVYIFKIAIVYFKNSIKSNEFNFDSSVFFFFLSCSKLLKLFIFLFLRLSFDFELFTLFSSLVDWTTAGFTIGSTFSCFWIKPSSNTECRHAKHLVLNFRIFCLV